jgi:hypothetical protein
LDDELLEELELPLPLLLPLLPPLFLLPLPLLELEPLLLEPLPELLELLELLLSESLSESDDELLELLLELLELELSLSLSLSLSGAASACWAMIRLGAFCRCSRRPSVMPPRPMAVQKLIAKRVFLGLSLGKSPWKEPCIVGSLSRSRSFLS